MKETAGMLRAGKRCTWRVSPAKTWDVPQTSVLSTLSKKSFVALG